jgi:hypothetical protein
MKASENPILRLVSGGGAFGPVGVDSGGGGPDNPDMSDPERLSKLEGAYDALKVVRPMTVTVLALLVAVMIGGFAFIGVQLVRIDGKLDGIPQTLREEFRAMRAEMAAQTSAIANSITAARQMQAPQPTPPNPQPKRP